MDHSTTDYAPAPYLKERLEERLNRKIVHWAIPDCGLSAATRYSLTLEDNSKAFVKAATDSQTEAWLRTEHKALTSYKTDCMPAVIDWIDEPGNLPILVTQDFSGAYWPASDKGVHWRKGDIALLLDTVERLSGIKGDDSLLKLKNYNAKIWTKIADRPDGFLKLDLCSPGWLRHAIDHLISAENSVDNTGNALVHGDIRSKAASQAAYSCATHIQRLSSQRSMPVWLINVFKRLIAIELKWAARCLNLDIPDGAKWDQGI